MKGETNSIIRNRLKSATLYECRLRIRRRALRFRKRAFCQAVMTRGNQRDDIISLRRRKPNRRARPHHDDKTKFKRASRLKFRLFVVPSRAKFRSENSLNSSRSPAERFSSVGTAARSASFRSQKFVRKTLAERLNHQRNQKRRSPVVQPFA